jgi:steroid delta-isomerase
MDALTRHQALFNEGVRSGDFGPWLATFHPDAVATFVGVPIGPFHGRDQIAVAYSEHPPSSTMRVVESSIDGDRVTARFVWADAPTTGGVFVLTLRGDKLAALAVTLDAPPPPPRVSDNN